VSAAASRSGPAPGRVPPAAEVARSTVAAAPVLLVRTPVASAPVAVAAVAADGALLLLVAETDPLVPAVRTADCGGLVAVVEAQAVTSAPVADRLLATAWLHGALSETTGAARCTAARLLAASCGQDPDAGGRRVADVAPGEAVLRLEVEEVDCVDATTTGAPVRVGAAAWAAARPDPLAAVAQHLVAHLAVGHPGAVAALTALALRARPALAGRRTALVALDRHGLRLRSVTPGGAVDTRLEFDRPADCPGALRHAVAALVDRAAAGPRDCEG